MRKLIAAAAVLAVTSAHAEELKFGDINYFLKQNQLNVAADIGSTYYKETVKSTGLTTTTKETRGYLIQSLFGLGLTDKLNVTLGLDYAFDNIVEDKTTPKNDRYSQNGLANPALGVNYRVMNQNEARYNFDVGAIVKYSYQDSKIGSSNKGQSANGNYNDGRSSVELNARMGRKWNEANEWQFTVGTIYHMSGETEVNGPATMNNLVTTYKGNYDLDSSFDVFARAAYQYRPVNEFMLGLVGEAKRVGSYDTKNTSQDKNGSEDSHLDMKLGFTAKYLITENFIANFHYSMSHLAEYDATVNGVDIERNKRRENSFGVGVNFLF